MKNSNMECPTWSLCKIINRVLPKFKGSEKPQEPLGGGYEQANSLQDQTHTISIQDYILSKTFNQQLVYERIYPNSLEQKHRDSYFLTEIFNIKKNSMLCEEDSIEVKLISNTMKTIGPKALTPYYTPKGEPDKTLVFESRFECGNLSLAAKLAENEYNLLLQNDINTQGYTQWFFFRTSNTSANTKIKFNIINFLKSDSLFNQGMRVLVYSSIMSANESLGWHRGGEDFKYFSNGIKKNQSSSKSLYTLSFTYEYKYSNDNVYFAYSFPYTYTDLNELLNSIEMNEEQNTICKRKLLCRTLAGNKCEYLTITSRSNNELKKGVVLSARTHPGETVGSWMMQGAIEFLTNMKDDLAILLRKKFVFKIIPMLNPDGVINGNYRCSLAGCDLNRRWKNPQKIVHPSIYHTKKLIKQFQSERELAFFCDMHGHSRKKNVFMYGCLDRDAPESTRVFPYILSSICPFFSYESSRFGNQKSKENTARISMWRELEIPSVYTIEASFCGCNNSEYSSLHFSTAQLKKIGKDLCIALLPYTQVDDIPMEITSSEIIDTPQEKEETKTIFQPHKKITRHLLVVSLAKSNVVNTLKQRKDWEKKVYEQDENSGSDDSPSDGELNSEVIDVILPHSKNKPGKKSNPKIKSYLKSIFGSKDKPPIPKPFLTESQGIENNEDEKQEQPVIIEAESKTVQPEIDISTSTNNEKFKDAFTQTEAIDFQKARAKYRFGTYLNINSRKNASSSMKVQYNKRKSVESVGPRERKNNESNLIAPGRLPSKKSEDSNDSRYKDKPIIHSNTPRNKLNDVKEANKAKPPKMHNNTHSLVTPNSTHQIDFDSKEHASNHEHSDAIEININKKNEKNKDKPASKKLPTKAAKTKLASKKKKKKTITKDAESAPNEVNVNINIYNTGDGASISSSIIIQK